MWIDSHCHLNHEGMDGAGSVHDIITRANSAGVTGMLSICCRMSEEEETLATIARAHDNVWFSLGTHPHDAGSADEQAISADELLQKALSYGKCIGIGEAGLDYYYDHAPREDQAMMFRRQIGAARESGLPLIIHTREAEEDTLRILCEEGACDGRTKVLMHCFSSNEWLARQSIDEGFFMSFSGMVTFKKNTALQDIVRLVPLERLLVETDAPFLAPVPYRGKTNEPAYVVHTGAFIADLFNLTREELATRTTENFFTLFDKARQTYIEHK